MQLLNFNKTFVILSTFVAAYVNASTSVGPSDWTGNLSTAAGTVTATSSWSSSGGGFKIDWSVTQTGNNFNYVYSITSASGGNLSKTMSHLILELSSTFTLANIWNNNQTILDGPRVFSPSDPGSSNPGLPGNIFGIKFDPGTNALQPVFSFTSDRAPIWGNFYSKDGKTDGVDVYAYNSNFLCPDCITGKIPVPDTLTVPEPMTYVTLGSMLALIAFLKFRPVSKKELQ